jgi:selenocysteine lyase
MKIPYEIASNAVRLSMGRETTKQEIDLVIEDLKETFNLLRFI